MNGTSKSGDFVGFREVSDSAYAFGGAVYLNGGSIGTLKGDFVANSADSHDGQGHGGARQNTSKVVYRVKKYN